MIGLKSRGRPPIKMAESVKDVVALKNEYAREIADRTKPLDDESRFYKSEMKQLEEKGIVLVKPTYEYKYEPPISQGETEKIQVQTIEFELDRREFSGSYKPAEDSQKGLAEATERQKYLTYTVKPQVRFAIRANEAAFFKYGIENGEGKIASWMDGRHWETGWKPPKGRVEWNLLRLGPAMALRYRIKSVSQQVSAN